MGHDFVSHALKIVVVVVGISLRMLMSGMSLLRMLVITISITAHARSYHFHHCACSSLPFPSLRMLGKSLPTMPCILPCSRLLSSDTRKQRNRICRNYVTKTYVTGRKKYSYSIMMHLVLLSNAKIKPPNVTSSTRTTLQHVEPDDFITSDSFSTHIRPFDMI